MFRVYATLPNYIFKWQNETYNSINPKTLVSEMEKTCILQRTHPSLTILYSMGGGGSWKQTGFELIGGT